MDQAPAACFVSPQTSPVSRVSLSASSFSSCLLSVSSATYCTGVDPRDPISTGEALQVSYLKCTCSFIDDRMFEL